MKVLVVHPGASWSTADVWRGITDALQRANVEVVQYALDKRMAFSQQFLDALWRKGKRAGSDLPRPTSGDVLYHAGIGVLERALRHQVDWVLAITGQYQLPDTFQLMRRAGLRVAVVLTESPYDEQMESAIAKMATIAFTNERSSVATFSAYCPTFYLPHSLDPARHRADIRDNVEVAAHDVVFVGTGFEERLMLLEAIDWDGIDLGLYGTFDLWGSRNRMRKYVRGGVIHNALTGALYRKAKIGLNLHRTSVGYGRGVEHIQYAESMNPRCYELAAAGCFFISDERAEVKEIFGDLVPTFRTPDEAEEIIQYYLAHEDERREIATRLPACVADCTFDRRVATMIEILEKHKGD